MTLSALPSEAGEAQNVTVLRRPADARVPLACWLAMPAMIAAERPPLVATHGIRRDAEEQAALLSSRAAELGRPVIAPHFDQTSWPYYQQVVREGRADQALLRLMRALKDEGVWLTATFDLAGFSGGGQFAHRFAMLHPETINRLTVVAAGWYTFPDDTLFPYGLASRPGQTRDWGPRFAERLDAFLQLPITVCVGAFDNRPDRNTRSGPDIERQQGRDRAARASRWAEALRCAARKRGLSADISHEILPGCGHDFAACVEQGGLDRLIFGASTGAGTALTPTPCFPSKRPPAVSCGKTVRRFQMTTTEPLKPEMLARAKWAFSTRRVPKHQAVLIDADLQSAASGDLIIGEVIQIGSHKRVQLTTGRNSELYVGDLVVLACGDRYAPDQFEGIAELDPEGADMLAGGGVIGRMRHSHGRMLPPTRIVPLGRLAGQTGTVLNLGAYALQPLTRPAALTVIGVVGASMNSGKTTAVASLTHGLTRAGRRVAAIKGTGTGAFGDYNAFIDAGAAFVADFTDAGMVSTYRQPLQRIASGFDTLLAHAKDADCDVAVMELADGVFQNETAELLKTPHIREGFAGVVFAGPDALAVAGGCAALRGMGIEPAAVTGTVSCSPLATLEAEAACGIAVMTREALRDPQEAAALLDHMLSDTVRMTPLPNAEKRAQGVGLAA